MMQESIRTEIAKLCVRRCMNCYNELPGYQVRGPGWNWLTNDVGPLCDECYAEVKPLLKEVK
jgi:hypothetical protein